MKMPKFDMPGAHLIIGKGLKQFKVLTPETTRVTEERTPKGQTISFLFEGTNVTVTDGYHTMEELYAHRYELFIALCKIYDNYVTPLNCRVKCWKSKFHHDGTMFPDSFIMGMTIVEFEKPDSQITYHLPIRYWNLINLTELDLAPKWDGHDSQEVLRRLRKL